MKPIVYEIRAFWRDRPEAPAQIGKAFLRALDAFEMIDPLLSKWGYFDKDNIPLGVAIDALRPTFTAFVEAHVEREGDALYPGDPVPEDGYTIYASNDYRPNGTATERSMFFMLRAGSKFQNLWLFKPVPYETPTNLSLITYSMYKAVLLTALSIWPAPSAVARCIVDDERPPQASGDPDFPFSAYQIPWIGYLSAENARGVAVPPEVISERTPDGGLLLIAAEERLEPSNPTHMRASKAIANIMIEHGGYFPY